MSRDSSALCAACGLCCNGVLHSTVTVMPQDVSEVRALGVLVEQDHQGCFQFHQPCPLHRDDHCTVYPDRPPSCRTYRCGLLRQVDEDALTLDTALAIVGTAKELARDTRTRTRPDETWNGFFLHLDRLWPDGSRLAGEGPERRTNGEVSLLVAALHTYLDKHFRTADDD